MDLWLLERFPGRTLEELDGIDFARLMRAEAARAIRDVEAMRAAYLDGKLPADAIPEAVWEAIERHDAMMDGDHGGT